jgi:ATP-dependent DNA helicase RecQ
LQQSDIKKISFSEFKCKNNCYFNIRSAKQIRNNRHIYTSDTIEYRPLVIKDTQGNYKNIAETEEHLKYFLQLLFRKEVFRPGQLPILDRALQNKSVIGLLPTGGGKSLTYQLAAMLQPGVTIVIDPLRSLMKDQYDGLIDNGIDTCTFINSTLLPQEKDAREKQMESSQMQFVFLSPERLCIYKFRERLRIMRDLHVYFAYGVIDEVHCVSEWGHDFRFSYLHLGRNLYNYVCTKNREKHLTLFGLTATASFDVLADVERELSGNGAFPLDADTIVRYENTNRLELQYKIEKVPVIGAKNKFEVYNTKQELLKNYIDQIPQYIGELQTEESLNRIKEKFIERQGNAEQTDIDLRTQFDNNFCEQQDEYLQAGIIFCPHKDSSGISVARNEMTLSKNFPSIGTFTGSSNNDEQDKKAFENLDKFKNNKLSLMVATKAFGMGIDKPNVRFTINMNYSSSLESFIQEAGRAGRDRKMALSVILYADNFGADLDTVMYFYNNNFKGGAVEKQTMHWLLSKLPTPVFYEDNSEYKETETETVNSFISHLLSMPEDKVIVAFISYDLQKLQNNLNQVEIYEGQIVTNSLERDSTKKTRKVQLQNDEIVSVDKDDIIAIDKDGINKAIYRMCCIGLIDDFTQDYINKRFRIVAKRKADGEYYQGLKRFLMRYYSADRAEEEIQKVPNYEGENEIHKCLVYLTEFIYEKIAVKRKRAIDDMRTFCIQGIDDKKDWKDVNEDLKDFIYYYFNSKYAKDDYIADNGEAFSLTEDTDRGKKSLPDIVLKYMRVVDDIVGAGGTPKDNVKHLQGAVRLIRRSLTDTNPTLDLLNAFCLFYLGINNNETLEEELRRSYQDGLVGFSERANNYNDFWTFFENFHKNITEKAREFPVDKLNDIKEEVIMTTHARIIRNLTNKYTEE